MPPLIARRGYLLLEVLMALAVASCLALSSLAVLSLGGNYLASVAVRKEIVVSAFSFLEQREAGIAPVDKQFRKGVCNYTLDEERKGFFKGESILIRGDLAGVRNQTVIWRPLSYR